MLLVTKLLDKGNEAAPPTKRRESKTTISTLLAITHNIALLQNITHEN